MRCPYCGGTNSDQATFCVNCGRSMVQQLSNQQNQSNPYPPTIPTQRQQNQPNPYPPTIPTQHQQPRSNPYPPTLPGRATSGNTVVQPERPVPQPSPQRQTASTASAAPASRRQTVAAMPESPAAPEAPTPFPPRTMEQLEALLNSGVQQYKVIESHVSFGKRKTVRILYPACANWQQTATLLKALRDQQEAQFETIIIQGVISQQSSSSTFTNGQLQFDRDIRLGSQIGNRYMIETGNGFASDSVRFVLNV
jgi:hypothetical protein